MNLLKRVLIIYSRIDIFNFLLLNYLQEKTRFFVHFFFEGHFIVLPLPSDIIPIW